MTHRTSQFLVAAELSRRGYTVAFTNDYTSAVDLTVGSSRGQFCVDVKGLASDAAWHVRPKPSTVDLYYILVRVASTDEQRRGKGDRFFVLSQESTNELIAKYQREHPNDRGSAPGFGWRDPFDYEGRWDCLPR